MMPRPFKLASLGWLAVVVCLCTIAAAKTTVEIPIFEGGEGTGFFLNCARNYEKLKPDVSIDLYGDPRIVDKVRVRLLERSFFDATNADLDYARLIKAGDCQPLDAALDGPCWDGHTTWRKTFLPGALDQYTIDGKTYGVPLPYFMYVIWYNKAIFAEHGWTVPHTQSEMLALCEKMKAAGVTPFAFCGRYPYYGEAFAQTAYHATVGPDEYRKQLELAPGSYNNPNFIAALTYAQTLALKYFEPGSAGMSHTEAQTQFFLSKTAMIPCGAWLKSEMMGKIPDGFRLGAFNYPLPDAGAQNGADPNAIDVLSTYYFVMKHGAHPAEATDFLRYMTSQQQAAEFARQRDIPTAVANTAEGFLSADVSDLIPIINKARQGYLNNGQCANPEIEQDSNDMLGKLFVGDITPAQGAKLMEAGARNIVAHNEHPDDIAINHVWQPVVLGIVILFGAGLWVFTAVQAFASRGKNSHAQLAPLLNWKNVLIFIAPAAVLYTAFVVVPSLRSFDWSMHRWDGITPMGSMKYIGFENFKRLLFEDDAFWTAMTNNLFIMIAVPLFVLPLALFLAASISRGVWGSNLFRIVFFFPNLFGSVATALLWAQMYNPVGGPVNTILTKLGFSSFASYAWLSPNHLYWSLIPLSVWGACGFNMVLYLAAMQGIPEDLYEAAEIDGATPWEQFWVITMPMIRTVFTISLVFLVIGGMKAFEIIWLLTNQRPVTANHVAGTLMVYRMFAEFKIGESTAIAVLLFLVVFVGSAITMRLTRSENYEG